MKEKLERKDQTGRESTQIMALVRVSEASRVCLKNADPDTESADGQCCRCSVFG